MPGRMSFNALEGRAVLSFRLLLGLYMADEAGLANDTMGPERL